MPITYMGYNLTNPLFQDVKVRQALSYAIDRQSIIDGILLGIGGALHRSVLVRLLGIQPECKEL